MMNNDEETIVGKIILEQFLSLCEGFIRETFTTHIFLVILQKLQCLLWPQTQFLHCLLKVKEIKDVSLRLKEVY